MRETRLPDLFHKCPDLPCLLLHRFGHIKPAEGLRDGPLLLRFVALPETRVPLPEPPAECLLLQLFYSLVEALRLEGHAANFRLHHGRAFHAPRRFLEAEIKDLWVDRLFSHLSPLCTVFLPVG
jgi:hypothetical protein